MTLPRRWPALAGTFIIATAVGATLIVLAVQAFGMPLIERFTGVLQDETALAYALEQVRQHGLPMLIVLALLPAPPRTAVLACALAGFAPVDVGLAVLLGRIAPATLIAVLGAKSPRLLRRIKRIDRVMRQVEAGRPQQSSY